MASYYCVIQYLPDPLADERINVGVIAGDDDATHIRLIEDWNRVRSFGTGDISAVRKRLLAFQEECKSEGREELEVLAKEWHHSIQVTPPRNSTDDAVELLDEMVGLMLKQRVHRTQTRTKSVLVSKARVSLERALDKSEAAGQKVEGRRPVEGRYVPHEVDLALTNGHVIMAAQALSFARPASPRVEKDIAATAWVIEDIRQSDEPPNLAVIVWPPDDTRRSDFTEARSLFQRLGSSVVLEQNVDRWARQVVAEAGS